MRVLVDPLYGSGAGWIPRLLAGGRIVVDEIHSERNPWFGGVNPEPIRPNVDEALARIRDGWLRPRAAARRRRGPGGRGRRAGHVHPPARRCMGLLMYYLLEHRGDARTRSCRRSTRRPWSAAWASATACAVHETPVGFKYVGPKMIETGAMMGGEESGGYGFGMHLPERDGIYADLLLLDLFVREREAGRWPVSAAVAAPARHRRARRSTCAPTSTPTAPPTPRSRSGCCVELRRACAADAGRRTGRAHDAARHRRRLQVLDRRRVLAAGPLQRHRAARAGLRGGEQRAAARRPAGRGRQDGRGLERDDGWTWAGRVARHPRRPGGDAARGPAGHARPGGRAPRPGARRRGACSRSLELPGRTAAASGRGPGHGRLGHRRRPGAWHLGRPADACRSRSCAATTCRPGSAATRSSSPAPRAAAPRRPSAPWRRRSSGAARSWS